jgi:hypothetical protein
MKSTPLVASPVAANKTVLSYPLIEEDYWCPITRKSAIPKSARMASGWLA